jgi:hypothetical protein
VCLRTAAMTGGPASSHSDKWLLHRHSQRNTTSLALLALWPSAACPFVPAWRGLLSLKRPGHPVGAAGAPSQVLNKWRSEPPPQNGCTRRRPLERTTARGEVVARVSAGASQNRRGAICVTGDHQKCKSRLRLRGRGAWTEVRGEMARMERWGVYHHRRDSDTPDYRRKRSCGPSISRDRVLEANSVPEMGDGQERGVGVPTSTGQCSCRFTAGPQRSLPHPQLLSHQRGERGG